MFLLRQHVQTCPDAPTIHQAYYGYYKNSLWTRLNPDQKYVGYTVYGKGTVSGYSEEPANVNYRGTAWATAGEDFGYTVNETQAVTLGGIAEMMDRTHYNNWSNNINKVLTE